MPGTISDPEAKGPCPLRFKVEIVIQQITKKPHKL